MRARDVQQVCRFRPKAGLERARAEGKTIGPPSKFDTARSLSWQNPPAFEQVREYVWQVPRVTVGLSVALGARGS